MKKVLISLVCCAGAVFMQAMEPEVPHYIATKDEQSRESLYRQTFKDYSYLDVAYATIPEEMIDMNAKDPFNQKTFTSLEKEKDNFLLARISTSETVYYCDASELYKKLVSAGTLPALSAPNDPFDQHAVIKAIDYYSPTNCRRCQPCRQARDAFYEDMDNLMRNPTKAPMSLPYNLCDNEIMSHCFSYEILRQYPDLVYALRGEKLSNIFKDPIETSHVAVKLCAMLSNLGRMGTEIGYYLQATDFKNSIASAEKYILSTDELLRWINERSDRKEHPIIVDKVEYLVFLKHVASFVKRGIGEMLACSTEAALKTCSDKYEKEWPEFIKQEKEKNSKQILQ